MSSQVVSAPRSSLNARQAETVRRLLEAGREVLDELGPDDLTIRMVATRAGVSAATAYTYFASKNHLFAELYWRHVQAHQPDLEALEATADPVARVQQVVRELLGATENSPSLAAAATQALLSRDPNMERLRLRVGAEFLRRFELAMADGVDPVALDALALAFSGALLQVGMEVNTYDEMADRLDTVIAVIMKGNR